MADTIVDIRFGAQPAYDPLYDASKNVTYLSGAADVNYTEQTVVINYRLAGAVTASVQSGSSIIPLSQDGDSYSFSYDGLSVSYFGQAPSSASSISYDQAAIPEAGVVADTYSASNAPVTPYVVCFAAGSLIRTVAGDKLVEELTVEDVVVTAGGTSRTIKWLGQRTIECARYPRIHEVMPVRICADAFGEGRPSRDLLVSPGHAICVDVIGEVLVPAGALVNGTTIRQESVERVTYCHVELESHDLLVAENLPTESYLDMGNRGFFPLPGEALALHGVPDAAPATCADFCRPFHVSGPLVDFVRDRLAARALQLDWVQVENPLADLHLVVDGKRITSEVLGLSARFLVPATAESVWLESDTVVPAMDGGGADPRTLGVCVGKLVIDDGFSLQTVLADDPRLGAGFHDVEKGPQRWTCGRARLSTELWKNCHSAFFLRVDLARPALPKWKRAAVETCLPVLAAVP